MLLLARGMNYLQGLEIFQSSRRQKLECKGTSTTTKCLNFPLQVALLTTCKNDLFTYKVTKKTYSLGCRLWAVKVEERNILKH